MSIKPTTLAKLTSRSTSKTASVDSPDASTASTVSEATLRARPDVAPLLTELELETALVPVIDVRFEVDGAELSFFSVVSTIGTPIDVTAQELRLEAFFPSDDATRARWSAMHPDGSRA